MPLRLLVRFVIPSSKSYEVILLRQLRCDDRVYLHEVGSKPEDVAANRSQYQHGLYDTSVVADRDRPRKEAAHEEPESGHYPKRCQIHRNFLAIFWCFSL